MTEHNDQQQADNTGVDDAQQPDPAETEQTDDQQPEKGSNAEAAKFRTQRNEARAERDQLTERLAAAEDRMLAFALDQAQLDPRLWKAAEIDLDGFRDDDGHLDLAAVVDKARTVEADLGITRGPRPNRQQGQAPGNTGAGELAGAFKPR